MKRRVKLSHLIILFALIILGGICFPHQKAYAATAVKVAAVEYYDENIVVFNNGNSKIYFATDTDAASNHWDCVDADKGGLFTTIDISWLSQGAENVIMIKGDLNDTRSRIIIKEKPSKLQVSINYTNITSLKSNDTIASLLNIMSTEGTSAFPITYADLEWKKGDNGKWRDTGSLTATVLEKFLVKGASLYFRIRAIDDCVTLKDNGIAVDLNNNRILGVDGGIRRYEKSTSAVYGALNPDGSDGTIYPDGTKGRRFSEEVKVKIAKKAATMVTGVDGEDFTAAIKYGKEYKVTVTYSDGSKGITDWVKVTDKAVKEMPLATLANGVTPRKYDAQKKVITYNGTTTAFPAMFIEVRDYATAKLSSSKITEISLGAQRTLAKTIQKGIPTATGTYTADDIFVYYFGDKYILMTIPAASATQTYEYCIVKPGYEFDLEHANWSLITKGTAVKLLANKAVQGGTLYVRQKEIKYKAASNTADAITYQLASTYVTHTIEYPSVPTITEANLSYTKGYNSTLTITVKLNESGKLPFEDTVKSIKLGSKEIGFTATINPTLEYINGVLNKDKAYTMTITLKNSDLETMTNCTNRFLTIAFDNGIVDKSSVKLTIKNPTASGSLTLTAVAGDKTGTTKVLVATPLGAGNSWVYVVSTTASPAYNTEDLLQSKLAAGIVPQAFASGNEIAVTKDQYITIYEVNAAGYVVKYKSLQIASTMIK